MIALKDLKEDILQWQKTKDEAILASIIYNLDYLIRYFIKKSRGKLRYLKTIENQDLYNDSIVALGDAIKSYPEDMSENYIPCRLGAYMLREFQRNYKYKTMEANCSSNEHVFLLRRNKNNENINLEEIDYNILLDMLDEDEREVVADYLIETNRGTAMAKKHGLSQQSSFIRKALGIIKNKFKK